MVCFCLTCAVFCLAYFILISIYTRGNASKLYLLWLTMSILLAICGSGILLGEQVGFPTRWISVVVYGLVGLILLIMVYPVSGILRCMHLQPEGTLVYLIVLGSHISGSVPTRSLKRRLDAAYDYAKDHQDTILLLSGGQGPDEIMTEASCMRYYLENLGIDHQRMVLEEKSTTTYENLLFCNELTGCSRKSTGILSNNFHVYRALCLAEKQGYHHVQGLAASADPVMQLHYVVREVLAWWKGKMTRIL